MPQPSSMVQKERFSVNTVMRSTSDIAPSLSIRDGWILKLSWEKRATWTHVLAVPEKFLKQRNVLQRSGLSIQTASPALNAQGS